MNDKIRLIHPHGPPFANQALRAFRDSGALADLITTIAFPEETTFSLPPFISRQLMRRAWIPENISYKRQMNREFVRLLLQQSKLARAFGLRAQSLTDWVYSNLDRYASELDFTNVTACYAYEDCAALTFRKAKDLGIKCFYDLPIMYWKEARSIEAIEAEKFPELSSALYTLSEPEWKLLRKEEELRLADKVIVASELTRNSLIKHGIDTSKVSIVPYGTLIPEIKRDKKTRGGFNVIFVGRVGPRKGVHHLLDAWKKLSLPNA